MRVFTSIAAILLGTAVFGPWFLGGAFVGAAALFWVMTQSGDAHIERIEQRTRDRCQAEIVAYAEGMAEGAKGNRVSEDRRVRASEVLGQYL